MGKGKNAPKVHLGKQYSAFDCFVVVVFPLEKKIPCYHEILFPRNIGSETVWTGMAVSPHGSLYKTEITR